MERKTLFNGFFFVLLAFMLFEAGRVLWPSGGALLGAAVLAIVFYPVHRWLGRYVRHPALRALLSDLFVLIFFFLPVGWVLWAGMAQSDIVILKARPAIDGLLRWAQSSPKETFSSLSDRFPGLAEQLKAISAAFDTHLASLAQRSFSLIARLGAEAAQLVWYVFLAIVALFFFFRDGEALIRQMNGLLPLRAEVKARIEERVQRLVIGAVRGGILTSLAQGVAAIIGFMILRTPFAYLLGFITMIVAIIPVVGSALIWVPISLYYFLNGVYWKGSFLLVWGMLAIGTIDNLLRPFLVGFRQDIPFFWLFFSMVGGLQVFGLFGILLGPLIIAVLIILLDIYRHVYLPSRNY